MQPIQIIIIIITCYFSFSTTLYISTSQWSMIQKLLDNKQLTSQMRSTIDTILFRYYDDWSYNTAKEFKTFHKHKCNHIPVDELHMYARMGLMNAIRNYKGKSVFSNYARIYIKGELYRGMTELHPLTSISAKDRKNKTLSFTNKDKLNTYFVNDKEWMLEKIYYDKNIESPNEMLTRQIIKDKWNAIHCELDIKSQRMIYYKFDYEWNTIRTNKEVAELMVCSEEHVRKTLKNLYLHEI